MSAFFQKHLRPESFPNVNGKFIHCWNTGNQGDVHSGVHSAEIKLFSDALIWNFPHAIRNARWALCLRRDLRLRRAQESFGKRGREECSRSDLRAKIAFSMKFREGEPYGGP